uniref:Alpha-mannosidase n=1 Tax=Dolopus genitalis TaxID=2488630 RepID=A0A3G5BIM3_DOLGE|nr:venom polypeptide [Dolopus genitalis]
MFVRICGVKLLLFIFYTTSAMSLFQNGCAYKNCPISLPDKLNVHLVPHTHDDVGWLKTVDQYYYGSKTTIQKAGVQYILDSVVDQLLRDRNRRFVYVESAFFFKWWEEQHEDLKEKVKNLVNERRLEFIGGAWSMNDEATTHYQSIIDQFAWGLKKLNDTFGKCGKPKVGWQIDTFGHSREMASLLAQMGYDGLFFARLDYQNKGKRLREKTAEMIWHASESLGETSDIFTGVLYNHYSAPPGFCFDILCNDEPIIDGKNSTENNVAERINKFLLYLDNMSTYYRTNNLMIPMGDDFTYQDANVWYKNLDKLIRYGNDKQKYGSIVNIFYSTPSCYLKSLHDSNVKWPVKTQDFLPYSTDPHSFWSGYFTSRSTLKRFERVGNHLLQVCKQLSALSMLQNQPFDNNLASLREVMGIMQHHDAITGTEKEKVAFDYSLQLYNAIEACSINVKEALKKLLKVEQTKELKDLGFQNCLNLNISACEVSEKSEKFIVTVYNPLNRLTSQYIRIPVPEGNYEVKDEKGFVISSQIVPIPVLVRKIPGRLSTAVNELVFEAKNVPSNGIISYFVSKSFGMFDDRSPKVILLRSRRDEPSSDTEFSIGNSEISLRFNQYGFLKNVTTQITGTKQLEQNFLYYEAAAGNNLEFANRSSGAYIFRPNGTEKELANKIEVKIYRGPLVEEVHQKFNDWTSQVVRIYKNVNFAEFEWLVGPIPVSDNIGKEVISRFTTNIQSSGIFYTDSNGREMVKRVRNYRDDFVPYLKELVAGNYYPITSKISLEDKENKLSILTDRAQGGGSLQDGVLELMIHRRLLHDDAFGVGEALNEMAFGEGLVTRGKHLLIFDRPSTSANILEKRIELMTLLPLWTTFSKANDLKFNNWENKMLNISLLTPLPEHIHLLTLETWSNQQLLIRFENILEKGQSIDISFDIMKLLRILNVQAYRETTLDGSSWLSDLKRLRFNYDKVNIRDAKQTNINEKDNLAPQIILKPMQIRTFMLFR